jgi:Family of unknown function (DUF6445)
MKRNVIVVDGFYKDPDRVRELGQDEFFDSGQAHNYPGYQATKSYWNQAIVDRLSELVGGPIHVDPEKYAFGAIRLITEESGNKPKVHHDGSTDWSGIVYLSKSGPAAAGTSTYRHRATGLVGPPDDTVAIELGYESAKDYNLSVVHRDAADLDAWEPTCFVGMAYNRLVLFRGSELFHAPGVGFGSGFDDGRLTQTFFFDDAKPAE